MAETDPAESDAASDAASDALSVDGARALGLSALAQIVEHAADGVFVCDAERRWVYTNDAACSVLGRRAEDLLGRDYVEVVPERDKATARRYYDALLSGSTELLTRMLIGADGHEREVVFAPLRVDVDGAPHGAAFFHDFTETRAAARTTVAIAQSAAAMVGTESIDAILASKARQAVEGTRAFWSGLAVIGAEGTFDFAGAYGPDGADFGGASPTLRVLRTAPAEAFVAAMTSGGTRVGGATSRAVALTRDTWERDPILSTFGSNVLELDWQLGVCMPLALDKQVNGALVILFPVGSTAVNDTEVSLCAALADHAAVAVVNERLSQQAARSAELRERRRVARDLHDSVSQALFAMTMHARTAQLAMDRADLRDAVALRESVAELAHLSRGTLAEMRSMLLELRPGALGEQGLVAALRTRAAAISARDRVTVLVDAPDTDVALVDEIEDVLYRIVSEALRNVVTHARAERAVVTVVVGDDVVRIVVADDGVGFDPADRTTDGSGLETMARLARSNGGSLHIGTGTGTGTTVSVEVPVPAETPSGAASS